MTALWLARLAREAGGLWPEPTDRARVTGPWRARRAAEGRRSGWAGASGEQGLMCWPLAGLRAGRGATRAVAGRTWHKPDCPDGPFSCGLELGGGKKEDGSQGTRSGEAERSLPFTLDSFLRDWKRPAAWLMGWEATKGAGPDQGLSWEAEHRPSEPLPGQSTHKAERGGTDERSPAEAGSQAGSLPHLAAPLSRLSVASRCPAFRERRGVARWRGGRSCLPAR